MKNKRTGHSPAFKAKVALAAVQEQESIAQLTKRHGIHANRIYKWKREFIEQAVVVCERGTPSSESSTEWEGELLKKIAESQEYSAKGLLWWSSRLRRKGKLASPRGKHVALARVVRTPTAVVVTAMSILNLNQTRQATALWTGRDAASSG